MSRFFKSAAFPILIVIVLAFFASKLISRFRPSRTSRASSSSSRRWTRARSRPSKMRTKDNSLEVTLDGGAKYQTGYPMNYEPILNEQAPLAETKAGNLDASSTSSRPARAFSCSAC